MQQRSVGATGLTVSRLGLGTMTWGRDTDEHEARDQLIAFVEAGGTLRRHRRRLRRRRVRGADRHADRRRRRPRRGRARDQGRHLAPQRRARDLRPRRGRLLADLDASLRRLGVDHVDLWQVHIWSDETPARGDAVRAGPRGRDRPGGVRRRSRTTPAGRPRRPPPGSGPSRAGRRWPRRRWSTPCSTAPSSTRCCRPRRRSASASCPGRRWAAAC